MNILISFLLLFGFTSKASEIYRISKILADDQRDLIFLNTGEVVESPDESITRIATQSLKEKKGVILKLQKLDDEFRRSIVDIESVEYGEFEPQPEHEFTKFNDERYFRTPLDHYTVHQYRKYEQAQALMNDFRRDTLNSSQCYNRAHVWTYEAFKKYNIYMGKMWIFYTDKYIREFKNWSRYWFKAIISRYTTYYIYNINNISKKIKVYITLMIRKFKYLFCPNTSSTTITKS